jgi:predicted nucleic acid-binding protein
MKIFLDTNVLLDPLDKKRGMHASSKRLVKAAEDGVIEIVVTGLSLVNLVYIMQRQGASHSLLMDYVQNILDIATIASTDSMQLRSAVASGWKDLEDAVQYEAALSSGKVRAIITSDGKGYKRSRIPVFTPDEFVAEHL